MANDVELVRQKSSTSLFSKEALCISTTEIGILFAPVNTVYRLHKICIFKWEFIGPNYFNIFRISNSTP